MPIVPMKKLVVFATKDISDDLIRTFGFLGVLDLRASTDIVGLEKVITEELNEVSILKERFKNLLEALGVDEKELLSIAENANIKILSVDDLKNFMETTGITLKNLVNKREELIKRIAELKKIKEVELKKIKEVKEYLALLGLKPSDLVRTKHLVSILGILDDKEKIIYLSNAAPTALIRYSPLGKRKYVVFIGILREYEDKLRELLSKLDFKEIEIPEKLEGEITEREIDQQLSKLEKELDSINKELQKLREKYKNTLASIFVSLEYHIEISKAKSQMLKSRLVYVLSGWVPEDKINDVKRYLDKLMKSHKVYYEIIEPTRFEDYPTYLKNPKAIKVFESVIRQYGQPSPHDIDPTPIVAFLWTLMFGFMFPDLGQGLFLVVLGFYLKRKKEFFGFPGKKIGELLIYAGISATIFGALFGEFFLLENVIHPLYPGLEEGWIVNKYYLLWVLKVALFFGIFMLALGIILSIYVNLKEKKYISALLGSRGIGGLLVLFGIVGIGFAMLGIRILPKIGPIGPIDIPEVSITAIGVVFSAQAFTYPYLFLSLPLYLLLTGIIFITVSIFVDKESEGIGELIETLIGLLSNTLSFLRIAIFSIAHVVYAYISTELLRIGFEQGGGILIIGLFIFIFLNVFSVTLEALIVFIQATRLTFYEFFTKFYKDGGVVYIPYRLSPILIKLFKMQMIVERR